MSSAQKAQLSMIAIGQYKLYFLIKPRPIKKSAFFFFASLSLSLSFSHLSMTVYFFCTVLSFFSLSLTVSATVRQSVFLLCASTHQRPPFLLTRGVSPLIGLHFGRWPALSVVCLLACLLASLLYRNLLCAPELPPSLLLSLSGLSTLASRQFSFYCPLQWFVCSILVYSLAAFSRFERFFRWPLLLTERTWTVSMCMCVCVCVFQVSTDWLNSLNLHRDFLFILHLHRLQLWFCDWPHCCFVFNVLVVQYSSLCLVF